MITEQIDMLSYLLPVQEFSLYNHLHDPTPGSNDMYTLLENGRIWYPKNQVKPGVMTGFDMNTFDEVSVRQKLTETNWADPGNFKSFISSQSIDGGIYWCPRYVSAGSFTDPVVITDTSFRIFTKGVPAMPQNVKTGQTQLSGPYLIDFGGDVRIQSCMVVTWQWNNGAVMEKFFYAGPHTFGWVMWTTSDLINGRYVERKRTCFNLIVKGSFAPLIFPYKY